MASKKRPAKKRAALTRNESIKVDAVKAATSAATTATLVTGATGSTTAGALAGVASLSAALVSLASGQALTWLLLSSENVFQVWLKYLAPAIGATSASVGPQITARAQAPESEATRSVLSESVRALLEVVDPAVVPSLAVLSGEYLKKDRHVDGFFRGTARTLADLTADELAMLRAILRVLDDVPEEDERLGYDARRAMLRGSGYNEGARVEASLFSGGVFGDAHVLVPADRTSLDLTEAEVRVVDRVFRLAVANGLAREAGSAVERGVIIDKDVVRRLLRIMPAAT